MIFWLGDLLKANKDYLFIGLLEGHLNININLGSGDYLLAFNVTRIDDGQWHQIDIVRSMKQIFVRIDHNVAVRGIIGGDKNQLNVKEALFLGKLDQV